MDTIDLNLIKLKRVLSSKCNWNIWFAKQEKRRGNLCGGTHTITNITLIQYIPRNMHTVFALLCFVVVIHWLIFPISIGLTSLALWQSNDCPSASKATLMNMDKYFMWIHYERLHNPNKAKHNKTVCIFLGYTVMLWCITHIPLHYKYIYANRHNIIQTA